MGGGKEAHKHSPKDNGCQQITNRVFSFYPISWQQDQNKHNLKNDRCSYCNTKLFLFIAFWFHHQVIKTRSHEKYY